ncbi:OmpP1/FadL family transporter [Sulfurospirillum sp. hDNRA2]|uniref:OmpP1/FadL family transporter n=1 Tax=Sulfurospirillum sp. hDNRA2 TaxID=3237298 RepID=UPI0020B77836|nr:OmpP1/FadL family transporter [Sulfurospirillum sp. DNRA8]MCP3652383.1 OmpP1/FadL family transporter [Sulfurospirillum sp. DNRA8]MCR1811233.1 OmpP1/FadL family transporter [Sulfurospirillum sp. DNRA8]
MTHSLRIATTLSLCAASLLASGYRIPEQSLNSVSLSAAYVASANGADASYYNPANMAFMAQGAYSEVALTYINLPQVNYDAAATTPSGNADGDSKEENFLMPNLHYVSPSVGNWRYGLSITAPAGLSKRWNEAYQMRTAEEFTLKVIEINPTASYKVNDQFALGFGLRGVYTDGKVAAIQNPVYAQELTGDSIDFGYNLALSYKPIQDLTFAATYRSKVDLTVKGDANGQISRYLLTHSLADLSTRIPFNTNASVEIPLPASLVLATAYTYAKTTVEFVFERTYWSSYKELDFDYGDSTANAVFGTAKPKNWKDANAYRIGVTHQCTDNLKMMLGFAIDKSPTPDSTLGFELPDSDAKLYSIGFEYKVNEKTSVGLAYLYDDKEERTVSNGTVNGTFTDSSAHLLTASFKYKF